jgi:NADPH2:quinone reductase
MTLAPPAVMRALVMSAPAPDASATAVREAPEPEPGPGQIAIRVSHAGINFMDVMTRRGDPGYVTSWPAVPGLEVAGTVHRLGPGVSSLRVGQPVAAFTGGGGLASIALADARLALPIPEGVGSALAAAAPLMLTTALLLLEDVAHLVPGERLLMQSAAGGVGLGVAQLARVMGAGLSIATVGSPARVPEAQALGWERVLPRDAGLVDAVRSAAPGGVDVILDPTGTQELARDLELAAPGARIVLFGNPSGQTPQALPSLGQLIGANVAIAGFSMSRLALTAPARLAGGLRRTLALLADGALALPLTEIGSLEAVPAVHDRLADRRGAGKYVVAID